MNLFRRSLPWYSSIQDSDDVEELKGMDQQPSSSRQATIQVKLCWVLVLTILFSFFTASGWILFFSHVFWWNHSTTPTGISHECLQPAIRREWRTLSDLEKDEYITAVQCLQMKPSALRNNGTTYDDFPWVHESTAQYGTLTDGALRTLIRFLDADIVA